MNRAGNTPPGTGSHARAGSPGSSQTNSRERKIDHQPTSSPELATAGTRPANGTRPAASTQDNARLPEHTGIRDAPFHSTRHHNAPHFYPWGEAASILRCSRCTVGILRKSRSGLSCYNWLRCARAPSTTCCGPSSPLNSRVFSVVRAPRAAGGSQRARDNLSNQFHKKDLQRHFESQWRAIPEIQPVRRPSGVRWRARDERLE